MGWIPFGDEVLRSLPGGPMAIVDRARAAVASLPAEVVYVGFSLGVLATQSLAPC
jgi:hypothetical protein